MIQLKTLLKVIDNSGATVVECIYPGKRSFARVGDEITAVVKRAKANLPGVAAQKLKKGDVIRALVVRTKSPVMRSDGSMIEFGDNAVVTLNKDGQPLGNRVLGPIAQECRQKRFGKVVSLAPRVI